MTDAPLVRCMTEADVPAGMALKDLAGWNQLRLDWERFLAFEPHGCFVVEVEGRLVGTASSISYLDRCGWIGMVLVHPDMRRRGLGRTLLEACLEYLDGVGVAAVKLDATPAGKPLYDTLGFVDEYPLCRWKGTGSAQAASGDGLRDLGPGDLEALRAFDSPVFGVDRQRVLARLLAEPTIRVAGCFSATGDLQGYAAVRPGQNACYLGPWIAVDAEVAERLWRWGLNALAGRPVYVDTLGPNPTAAEFVAASGFAVQREFMRMYRGQNRCPGQPERQYGIFGPEIG